MNLAAFDKSVHRYQQPLQRYCMRFVSQSVAEEVVQETFLSAYQALNTGEEVKNFEGWLYRIAHNKALNTLDRERRRNHASLDELTEKKVASIGQSDNLHARAETQQLFRELSGLPERQRSALVLSALGGFSHDDIAAELKTSRGSVRQLISRARTHLREGLAGLLPLPLARRWYKLSDFALQVHVRTVEATAFTKLVPVLGIVATGVTVQQVVARDVTSPVSKQVAVASSQPSRNALAATISGFRPGALQEGQDVGHHVSPRGNKGRVAESKEGKQKRRESVNTQQDSRHGSTSQTKQGATHLPHYSPPTYPSGTGSSSESASESSAPPVPTSSPPSSSGGDDGSFDTRPSSPPPTVEPSVPPSAPFEP